jgi:hypothetical protein
MPTLLGKLFGDVGTRPGRKETALAPTVPSGEFKITFFFLQ